MMTPQSPGQSPPPTDGVLVGRARKGDAEAFQALFARHGHAAWRMAFVVTADRDLSTQAAVGGLARAVRETPARDDEPGRFLAELLAVTREAAAALAAADPVPPTAGTALASAFWRLPERWRSILWVTRAEGLAAADAALVLGISLRGAPLLAERAGAGLDQALAPGAAGAVEGGEWHALVPPAPGDLAAAAEARWRGATSRRARLLAAATAGPSSPEMRQRLSYVTAGVLGLGILGTIMISPHLPNRLGDIPVAEAGNGFRFNDPLSKYHARPDDPARIAGGSTDRADVALISLVTSNNFSDSFDPAAPLFDGGSGSELAAGPLGAVPQPGSGQGGGPLANGPAGTPATTVPGAPDGGVPLPDTGLPLPDPGPSPLTPPSTNPITPPGLPLPTTTVPGTPPITTPGIATPGSPQPTAPSVTLPPVTSPPATLPPVTRPPAQLPSTSVPAPTLPPATLPPATVPPATQPQATLPPPTLPATTVPVPATTIPPAPVTSTVTTVVQTITTLITAPAVTVTTPPTTAPLPPVTVPVTPPKVI